MEPNVKSAIEDLVKRFDSFDAKWEARFAQADSQRLAKEAAVDQRLTALESGTNLEIQSRFPEVELRVAVLEGAPLQEIQARLPAVERRVAALEAAPFPEVPSRVAVLEDYCAAQSDAAAQVDDWGRTVDQRVVDLELQVDDLQSIRLAEVRDEREDRIEALEDAVKVFDDWCPRLEASVEDVRRDVQRLFTIEQGGRRVDPVWTSEDTAPATTPPTAATSAPAAASVRPIVAHLPATPAAHYAGRAAAEPPDGHRVPGYGLVTTIAPPQSYGTSRPPPQFPRMNPIPHGSSFVYLTRNNFHPTHPPDPPNNFPAQYTAPNSSAFLTTSEFRPQPP